MRLAVIDNFGLWLVGIAPDEHHLPASPLRPLKPLERLPGGNADRVARIGGQGGEPVSSSLDAQRPQAPRRRLTDAPVGISNALHQRAGDSLALALRFNCRMPYETEGSR
jgi:hypothetical protein